MMLPFEFMGVLILLGVVVVALSGALCWVIRDQRIQIRELTAALLAQGVPSGGGMQQYLRAYVRPPAIVPPKEPPAPRPGIQVSHGE